MFRRIVRWFGVEGLIILAILGAVLVLIAVINAFMPKSAEGAISSPNHTDVKLIRDGERVTVILSNLVDDVRIAEQERGKSPTVTVLVVTQDGDTVGVRVRDPGTLSIIGVVMKPKEAGNDGFTDHEDRRWKHVAGTPLGDEKTLVLKGEVTKKRGEKFRLSENAPSNRVWEREE